MKRFKTDRYHEQLFFEKEEVYTEDGEAFDLLASRVKDVRLSEIPEGIAVRLCDPIIGSNDLCNRAPDVIFENSCKHGLVVHVTSPIIPPKEDMESGALADLFVSALDDGEKSLECLKSVGRLIEVDRSIYEDIAFLSFTITMFDMTLLEAEAFATEIEDRVLNAYKPPNLFVCHASEDKGFVDILVSQLDRRAFFAWYDKREIVVGDSIVDKVNTALGDSDYLIAVLSPRSVSKPWVMREINSSLMRQLGTKNIRILPVLVESCDIPVLFADIKYADFTKSFDEGLTDLVAALRRYASD